MDGCDAISWGKRNEIDLGKHKDWGKARMVHLALATNGDSGIFTD